MISLTGRYLFIVIGALLGWIVFFACSDGGSPSPGNGSQNTPMVIETDLPTNYRIDNPPQHRFGLADQDGISDGLVAYTENDSLVWEKNLENFNSNSWDTTWTPKPANAGTASLEWYVKDDFQEGEQEVRTGKHEIELLSPEPDANTPTEFSADIPTFKVGEQANLYLAATDRDTLDTLTLLETKPDGSTNSFSVTPNSVDWDTTFNRTYANAGDVNWTITATDKHPNPETREETYTTTVLEPDENTPTQFTADIPTFTRGEEGTVTFTVADPDTLTSIILRETRPDGSTHTFNTSLHAVDWDTTIHRTYNQAGEANWSIAATDKHPNPETREEEYTIEILPTSQTYTLEGEVKNPVLNQPATGVQLELFNQEAQQLDQTTSNTEGQATLQHTQGEDKPTNNHAIRTSGIGYETQNHTIDLTDETFSYELTPTQILTSNPNWSIEPRDSILVNLSDAVDTQGVPLESIVVQNTSSNVSARQDNGNNYWLRVENDAANTQENINLEVRTTTNQKTHSIPVTIQPRANINYTNTFFEVGEDNTLALDLLEYISSGVDVDSTHISSPDNRLEIVREAANEYRLIPQQDFSGNIQLDLFASNKHGSETNTTGTLDVQRAPRITIRVENNETNQHTPGLEAHLGVYNPTATKTDTASNETGIFEIKLTEPGEHKILARYTRNGETFSYIRTDYIDNDNTGVDQEHLTRIVDFYIREQDGTIVDELKHGEPGIANPEGFRQFAKGILRGGVGAWNGEPVQATEFGTFNCYATSVNGRGPDKLLIAEIFHRIDNGQTSYLTDRIKNIMLDVYENDIAPWMGEYAPETETVDSLAYDWENNQYMNKPFFAPNSHPEPGEAGRVFVFGEAPNNIYNASAWIRSDGEGTDAQIESATSQEATAAFGFMSTTPANNWAENDQSIVYNFNVLQRPTLFDGKLMRAVWEPTYTCTPTQVTYTKNVFGKPDY